MRAIVNGVKTRLENLAARLSAEEQPMCQLHLKVTTVGTLAYTLNQGLLSESLMFVCAAFLQQLTKEKKEGRSEGEDVGSQILLVERLETMLNARAEEPLVVTIAVDGGPARPVPDSDAPLARSLADTEQDPKDVTICVTPEDLHEALAAPRCLLVITDPGGTQLHPLDERTLKTPLMELAWTRCGRRR